MAIERRVGGPKGRPPPISSSGLLRDMGLQVRIPTHFDIESLRIAPSHPMAVSIPTP